MTGKPTINRTSADPSEAITDQVMALIEEYREKNLHYPIIVEGERDFRSLRSLGFPGEIYKINSGHTLMEFSESIAEKHRMLILMMDFDEKGRELTGRLQVMLSSSGCTVDLELWTRTRNILNISAVEEMYSAVERMNKARF